MTLVRGWVKFRRLDLALLVTVVSIALIWLRSRSSLSIPFLPAPVPIPVLMLLTLAALPCVILADRLGPLGQSFPGARRERLLAVTLTVAAALAPFVLLWARGHGDPSPEVGVLIVTVAVVAATLLGPNAWVLAMGFAAVSVGVDLMLPSRPVSSAAAVIPAWGHVIALGAVCLNYVWRGPRTWEDEA